MGIDPKNHNISHYLRIKRLEYFQENGIKSENNAVISDATSSNCVTSSLPDLNSLP